MYFIFRGYFIIINIRLLFFFIYFLHSFASEVCEEYFSKFNKLHITNEQRSIKFVEQTKLRHFKLEIKKIFSVYDKSTQYFRNWKFSNYLFFFLYLFIGDI